MTMKITISAENGEGKTTVALLLADFLRTQGFGVVLDDPDVNLGIDFPQLQERRLAAIAKLSRQAAGSAIGNGRRALSVVLIETVQIRARRDIEKERQAISDRLKNLSAEQVNRMYDTMCKFTGT